MECNSNQGVLRIYYIANVVTNVSSRGCQPLLISKNNQFVFSPSKEHVSPSITLLPEIMKGNAQETLHLFSCRM